MMSAGSSSPTESRIMSSPTPAAASASAPTCRWVVEAGWITRVLASPTLARWEASSHALDEAPAGAAAALDPEAHHRARALGQNPLGQPVVGVAGERGMQHPGDRLVGGEELDHRMGVGDVALDPERQGLDPLQDVERVLRAHAGAEIAQALGARPHVERRRAVGLGVDQAVIAGVGLGHASGTCPRPASRSARRRPGCRRSRCRGRRATWSPNAAPGRRPCSNGRHRQGVAKVLSIRSGRAVRVGDLGDRGDVQDLEAGIADRLAEHEAGLGPDRRGEGGGRRAGRRSSSRCRSAAA